MSSFKNNISKSTQYRAKRVVNLFDIYRLNPWTDKRGPFGKLLAYHTDLTLFQWLITVSFTIRIITVAAFIRILRPALTKDALNNGSFKFIDMVLDRGYDINIYYKESAFDTIKSALFGGLNRLVRVQRDQYRIDHINDAILPAWIDGYRYITISDPAQTILSDLCDELKKKCFKLRGASLSKAKPMAAKDFQTIQNNVIKQYYPTLPKYYATSHKWDPNDLNLSLMCRIAALDVSRAASEWRKRSIKDYKIINKSDGKYLRITKSVGTKSVKSGKDLKQRGYLLVKERPDRGGIVNLICMNMELRPVNADLTDNNGEPETALFLRPLQYIKIRNNGTHKGYYNSPVGEHTLQRMWNSICARFAITPCSLYSLRATVSTYMVRSGMHPMDAARHTGHTSNEVYKYIHDEKEDEQNVELNNVWQDVVLGITSEPSPNNNHNNNISFGRALTDKEVAAIKDSDDEDVTILNNTQSKPIISSSSQPITFNNIANNTQPITSSSSQPIAFNNMPQFLFNSDDDDDDDQDENKTDVKMSDNSNNQQRNNQNIASNDNGNNGLVSNVLNVIPSVVSSQKNNSSSSNVGNNGNTGSASNVLNVIPSVLSSRKNNSSSSNVSNNAFASSPSDSNNQNDNNNNIDISLPDLNDNVFNKSNISSSNNNISIALGSNNNNAPPPRSRRNRNFELFPRKVLPNYSDNLNDNNNTNNNNHSSSNNNISISFNSNNNSNNNSNKPIPKSIVLPSIPMSKFIVHIAKVEDMTHDQFALIYFSKQFADNVIQEKCKKHNISPVSYYVKRASVYNKVPMQIVFWNDGHFDIYWKTLTIKVNYLGYSKWIEPAYDCGYLECDEFYPAVQKRIKLNSTPKFQCDEDLPLKHPHIPFTYGRPRGLWPLL